MYVGYNKVYTVYGKVYGDTLLIIEPTENLKFPTKQKNLTKKQGFIQFIREANGVCDILRIVEHEL